MGDLLSGNTLMLSALTPLSFRKSMMKRPTLSLPVSAMKVVPSEMMALNTEPPGTALMGCPFLKMMSSVVSPIPITFRMIVDGC